jgi:energy-converting hydrogenase A subunit R
MTMQYVTDCEGPVSLNDNAMEMAGEFIPNGENFFVKLSRYDDYLADIVEKPGYKAGDTLRLIIPFFKAYRVTESMMTAFSQQNVLLVPDAAAALDKIRASMEAFIISTSYEPYIRALCQTIDFPFASTYCTALDIDSYVLEEREQARLVSLKEEVDGLPDYEIAPGALSFDDLSDDARQTIGRLQDIFWNELPGMKAGALLTAVDPVGGRDKARALEDSLMRTGARLSDTIYVGDSITDVQAFQLVKRGGGLAVSFNGNRYAIEAADVAVYGHGAMILSLIADAFMAGGKDGVYVLLRDMAPSTIEQIKLSGGGRVEDFDREKMITESETVRKEIRGVAGQLG